jgi:hypothetical protein
MRHHVVAIGFRVRRKMPSFTVAQRFVPNQKAEKLGSFFVSFLWVASNGGQSIV